MVDLNLELKQMIIDTLDLEDIGEELSRITAPVLILWGEENPQLPVGHAALYRDQLVNAARVQAIVYPGVGHVIPLERPQQSARDTRAFLERLP